MQVKDQTGVMVSIKWTDLDEVTTQDSRDHAFGDTISATQLHGQVYFNRNGAMIADLRKMIRVGVAKRDSTADKVGTAKAKKLKYK
jgi:hypothetical protein